LSHFEDRSADPVSVPYANLSVGETFDREILSKLSVLEVISAEFALPIAVGFELINHNGTMFTPVALEIALAIAVQIEPSSKDAPGERAFPDGGADDLPLPRDFAWKAHVDGQKFRHWSSSGLFDPPNETRDACLHYLIEPRRLEPESAGCSAPTAIKTQESACIYWTKVSTYTLSHAGREARQRFGRQGLTRNKMDTDGVLPTRVFGQFFINYKGGYVIANPHPVDNAGAR